jgi:hypothetical protein
MSDKRAALAEIAALAEQHGITPEEVAAFLAGARSPGKDRTVIGKVLSYVGGVLVFSGVGLLIGFLWDEIGSAERVILTLGTGLAAFVLATLCASDPRFEKAATPLFLVAALMQPTGLFVFLHETMPPSDDPLLAAILVFGVLAAQQGLAFWALGRTSLLFLAVVFWIFCLGTATVWLEWNGETVGIVLGIALLCLSWALGRTPHLAIAPFWSFAGGATLLASWWARFADTPLDLTFVGLDGFLIYLAVRSGNRSLLFVSVLGLLAYLSYFAWEYFADVIGWPIALIVLGLILIGLTGWAVKLGKSRPAAE